MVVVVAAAAAVVVVACSCKQPEIASNLHFLTSNELLTLD